ncbi:MAG: hypothetical protein OXG88_03675 [Gammaproteobacteria bacterium]|nr:hypothetical protein [Gammaproteobacteria bacterium]
MTIPPKLHIDLSQGLVNVEGDTDFVRDVYTDFKQKILARSDSFPAMVENKVTNTATNKTSPQSNRRIAQKKSSNSKKGGGPDPDSPKLDKNLDTSALSEFYSRYKPKNHSEKILLFVQFLKEKLSIEKPSTDQVFTCYDAVKEKLPNAFKKAFHLASSRRYGFIDYKSASNIAITVKGKNHFIDLQKGAE